MSDQVKFYMVHPQARDNAKRYTEIAPHGWSCIFSPPLKKRIQEEKYHAMIGDISKCCEFMGRKRDTESWKRLLIEAFVNVMRETARAQGCANPFPDDSDVLPSLDGKRIIQLGVQSRKFTIALACEFIEFLSAWGAENNVTWKESSRVPAWMDIKEST